MINKNNNNSLNELITDEKLNKINQIIEYNYLRMNVLNKNDSEFTKIKNFIEKEGDIIYKQNDFFKDLHNLMNNPQFNEFYKKYFANWMDTEVMIMYMKLYDTLKSSFKNKFNEDISSSMLLFIIRQIIRNNDTRKIVLDNFKLFKKGFTQKKINKIKKMNKLKDKLIEDINKIKS